MRSCEALYPKSHAMRTRSLTDIPLPPELEHQQVPDLIAAVGGAKAAVYETFVRLSRDGVTATIPMESLVADPAENIYAQAGDVLTLTATP